MSSSDIGHPKVQRYCGLGFCEVSELPELHHKTPSLQVIQYDLDCLEFSEAEINDKTQAKNLNYKPGRTDVLLILGKRREQDSAGQNQ